VLIIGAVYLVIVGFVVVATYLPNTRLPGVFSEKGTLIVKLTDAPVDLEHLNLTISSLSALRVEHVFDFPTRETWENLSFVEGVTDVDIDILALHNVSKDLSITEIPPGNYTHLRMAITAAKATFVDGKTVDLIVPPGHINVIIHFKIEAGETTVLLVDVEADWVAVSQSGRLRPVLKASVVPD